MAEESDSIQRRLMQIGHAFLQADPKYQAVKLMEDRTPEKGDDSIQPTVSPIDLVPYEGVASVGLTAAKSPLARRFLADEVGKIGNLKRAPSYLDQEIEKSLQISQRFNDLMTQRLGPKWNEVISKSSEPTNVQLNEKWRELADKHADLLSKSFKQKENE
jgi:hypothetical protein